MILEATWLQPDDALPKLRYGGCYNDEGPNLEGVGTAWAFILERAPGTRLHSFACSRWLIDDDATDDAAADLIEFRLQWPDGTFGHLSALVHHASGRTWLRPA